MADQKRWFKVWTTIITDPSFLSLPLHSVARWTILGAWIASHGENGSIQAPETSIRSILRIPGEMLIESALKMVPNVTCNVSQKRHGELTVTMCNWRKYQEDSTAAKRQESRRKRRREEKRGEERRRDLQKELPPSPSSAPNGISADQLIALYNELAPSECPAVVRSSPARKEKARKYLSIFPDRQFWERAFRQIQESQFLRGLRKSEGHQHFIADFDWLLSKGKDGTENVVKVHDGRYRDG